MSPAVFAECVASLAVLFPHPAMNDQRMALYRRFLIDLEDSEIQRATATYITESAGKESVFFPTIAALRNLARPLPTDVELAPIFRDIERLNRWSPEGHFISPREVRDRLGPFAFEAFVAVGGDSVFQRLDLKDNRPFVMKKFFECYREAQKNGARVELLGPIPDRMQQIVAATAKKLTAGTP